MSRWTRLDAVPDGCVAVIPNGFAAGILYRTADEAGTPFPARPIAWLWSDDGVSLPGWQLPIETPAAEAERLERMAEGAFVDNRLDRLTGPGDDDYEG